MTASDLGWIPANRVYTAGAGSHTVTLERATFPGSNAYLLAFIPINGSSSHFYTVEARSLVGYDAKLPGEAVVIHEIGGPVHERLLVDPSLYYVGDGDSAMWMPGETFGSPQYGILVKVNNATPSGFEITIVNGGVLTQTRSLALSRIPMFRKIHRRPTMAAISSC